MAKILELVIIALIVGILGSGAFELLKEYFLKLNAFWRIATLVGGIGIAVGLAVLDQVVPDVEQIHVTVPVPQFSSAPVEVKQVSLTAKAPILPDQTTRPHSKHSGWSWESPIRPFHQKSTLFLSSTGACIQDVPSRPDECRFLVDLCRRVLDLEWPCFCASRKQDRLHRSVDRHRYPRRRLGNRDRTRRDILALLS
jgi:hypothetical protein